MSCYSGYKMAFLMLEPFHFLIILWDFWAEYAVLGGKLTSKCKNTHTHKHVLLDTYQTGRIPRLQWNIYIFYHTSS